MPLPADEYRSLRRRREQEQLWGRQSGYSDSSSSSSWSVPSSRFSSNGRPKFDPVRNATRNALADPYSGLNDDWDELDRYEEHRRRGGRNDRIPDKYLREFNQRWHEDDEDRDSDRLLADLAAPGAATWRHHEPLFDRSVRGMLDHAEDNSRSHDHYGASARTGGSRPLPRHYGFPLRAEYRRAEMLPASLGPGRVGYIRETEPQLQSKFSWDEDAGGKKLRFGKTLRRR